MAVSILGFSTLPRGQARPRAGRTSRFPRCIPSTRRSPSASNCPTEWSPVRKDHESLSSWIRPDPRRVARGTAAESEAWVIPRRFLAHRWTTKQNRRRTRRLLEAHAAKVERSDARLDQRVLFLLKEDFDDVFCLFFVAISPTYPHNRKSGRDKIDSTGRLIAPKSPDRNRDEDFQASRSAKPPKIGYGAQESL